MASEQQHLLEKRASLRAKVYPAFADRHNLLAPRLFFKLREKFVGDVGIGLRRHAGGSPGMHADAVGLLRVERDFFFAYANAVDCFRLRKLMMCMYIQ